MSGSFRARGAAREGRDGGRCEGRAAEGGLLHPRGRRQSAAAALVDVRRAGLRSGGRLGSRGVEDCLDFNVDTVNLIATGRYQ